MDLWLTGWAGFREKVDSKRLSSDDIMRFKLEMDMMAASRHSFRSSRAFLLGVLIQVCAAGVPVPASASPGAEVFQGFIQHISVQIVKDKQEFSVADTHGVVLQAVGRRISGGQCRSYSIYPNPKHLGFGLPGALSEWADVGQGGLRANPAGFILKFDLFSDGPGGGWR